MTPFVAVISLISAMLVPKTVAPSKLGFDAVGIDDRAGGGEVYAVNFDFAFPHQL